MKIALLADIHANVRALEACLADAQKEGADQYAFLGDLVGYGAEPAAVLDKVMQWVAEGAWCLRGNHDDMALYPPVSEGKALGEQGIHWTHSQLNAAHLQFLKSLPLTHTHGSLFLVHASARDPEKWSYVHDDIQAGRSLEAATHNPEIRYVFGGHVHHQTLYYRGGGRGLQSFTPTHGVSIPVSAHRYWVATVGSVGQPRDKKVQAMYALFDVQAQKLMFRRVPYDHTAAAAAIRKVTGLPSYFADRLLLGQ